jgi:hypothetical protein
MKSKASSIRNGISGAPFPETIMYRLDHLCRQKFTSSFRAAFWDARILGPLARLMRLKIY